MHRFIGRRLLALIVMIPLLNALGFFYALKAQPLFRTATGSISASQAAPAAEQAFWPLYSAYLAQIRQGQWGAIWKQIPIDRYITNTLQLIGVTIGVVLILAPLVGLLAVSPRTRRIRPTAVAIFTLGSSLPGFFFATVVMLLLIIGLRQGWYTTQRGYLIPIQGSGFDAHLILPILTLAIRPIMYVGSLMAGMIEHELHQDYVRVARGKGLPWRLVAWRHVLPNIHATVIAALGQGIQFVMSSLILVETLFDWRGLGWLLMRVFIEPGRGSASQILMNPVILAILLPLFGGFILLFDGLAQILSRSVDPRLQHGEAALEGGHR